MTYLPKRYLFDTGVLRELRESAVPAISAVHTMAAAARTPLGAVIANLTPYGETSVDGARIVNLPAYLLERLARGVP